MIVFNRTAAIASGKTTGAMSFAQQVAGHFKNTYDIQLEVSTPIGGNPQRVAWSARYKDLAALDTLNQKLAGDKAYWELVGKASDCFIAGSIHDSIWRTL
jgi:hypothetical protein